MYALARTMGKSNHTTEVQKAITYFDQEGTE